MLGGWVLGALGALVKSRKRFVRQTFVHYDEELGVAGFQTFVAFLPV